MATPMAPRIQWKSPGGSVPDNRRIQHRHTVSLAVKLTGSTIRRRIGDEKSPMDFPILHDMQQEGITDYVAQPMRFLGGQIRGEDPGLYLIYPQGNPLQATEDSPYLQLGECKYGRPVLDRGIDMATSLEVAAKYALLSFDATIRSIFRPGAMATYSFDASASYNAIRIATQQHQVIDGSANFDLSAHAQVSGTNHDSDATFDIHAQITFHADHTADLVLDGSQHYSLDLTTGAVARVNN